MGRMGGMPAADQIYDCPRLAYRLPTAERSVPTLALGPGVIPALLQLVLDRLQDGGFRSRGLPADALTIATVETGVALRCFDADRLVGELCIRDAAPGERLPGRASDLAAGTLTIADATGPVGLLFGETAAGREVERDSRRIAIAAVGVGAVPSISIDEALWIAAATLEAA